ncbi:MAG: hypothetical protein R2733_17330 [Acidimicrobiales bacterium]
MTLVVVVAAKGAPGATTTSAALAAAGAIRNMPTLLVELDPAGGSFALETQRSLDPGLGTLLAAARRGLDSSLLTAHSQVLASGVEVLLAPTAPDRAKRVVTTLAGGLAELLKQRPGLTIVDGGRWDGDNSLTPVLAAADHVIVLLRPNASGTEALRNRLSGLAEINRSNAVVCVGDQPYSAQEVAAALGVAAEAPIAHDARAARLVVSGVPLDRWLRRSSLMRSTLDMVDRLTANHDSEVLV